MKNSNSAKLAVVPSVPAREPAPAEPVSGYAKPPAHFKRKPQRDAWADLVARSAPDLHVPANYFTFEMAATLVAKFRSGKPMNATEHKEMKKLLVVLGLAKADNDDKPKKKPNAHYFDR
jgi:hypothetical protein